MGHQASDLARHVATLAVTTRVAYACCVIASAAETDVKRTILRECQARSRAQEPSTAQRRKQSSACLHANKAMTTFINYYKLCRTSNYIYMLLNKSKINLFILLYLYIVIYPQLLLF